MVHTRGTIQEQTQEQNQSYPFFPWGWGLSLLLRIEIVRILNFANRHCHVCKRDSRRSRELEVGELNFEVEFYKSLNRPESQCHPWHTDGSLSAAHPLLFIALPHFPDWISMLSHPAGEKWPVLCPALSQPAHCSESPPEHQPTTEPRAADFQRLPLFLSHISTRLSSALSLHISFSRSATPPDNPSPPRHQAPSPSID